jgi:hypothetical protein
VRRPAAFAAQIVATICGFGYFLFAPVTIPLTLALVWRYRTATEADMASQFRRPAHQAAKDDASATFPPSSANGSYGMHADGAAPARSSVMRAANDNFGSSYQRAGSSVDGGDSAFGQLLPEAGRKAMPKPASALAVPLVHDPDTAALDAAYLAAAAQALAACKVAGLRQGGTFGHASSAASSA